MGFTRVVKEHKEINKVYKYLKILHGKGRHIVCAYCLPGLMPTDEGYEKYGAGRKLLYLMREANIINRVFFVARYYGDTNLGGVRFQGYKEAMTNALLNDPHNTITGEQDIIDNTRGGRYLSNFRQSDGGGSRGAVRGGSYAGRGRGISPRVREDHLQPQRQQRLQPSEQEWQEYLKQRFSDETLRKLTQIQEAENYQAHVLAPKTVTNVVAELDEEVSF